MYMYMYMYVCMYVCIYIYMYIYIYRYICASGEGVRMQEFEAKALLRLMLREEASRTLRGKLRAFQGGREAPIPYVYEQLCEIMNH